MTHIVDILTLIIVTIIALALAGDYLSKKRRKRMIPPLSRYRPLPPGLTELEVAETQLSDWQNLLADLIDLNAPVDQQRYCRKRIKELMAEVKRLENQ